MTSNRKWIESGGGPLVFVAESEVPKWKGFEPASGEMESDYDLACAVPSPIAATTIRGMAVVVLGDEPDRTTVATFDALMYWIRWRAAPSEQALWEALDTVDLAGLEWKAAGSFDAQEQGFRLFDAAFSGSEIESSLSFLISPGSYSIETSLFKPSSDIEVLLHRFRKT